MVLAVSGPQIIAFLEWLRVNHTELVSGVSLDERQGQYLAEAFLKATQNPARQNARDLQKELLSGRLPIGYLGNSPRKVDLISRYRTVPLRMVLLYTSYDSRLREFAETHLESISRESGPLIDLYVHPISVGKNRSKGGLTLSQRLQLFSFCESYVLSLGSIPGARVDDIRRAGLPCALIWSDHDHVHVPFADVADSDERIKNRLRMIFDCAFAGGLPELRARLRMDDGPMDATPQDVFISYSHQDRVFADRLHDSLEEDGLETWYDRHMAPGVRQFDWRVDHYVRECASCVVLWSRSSVKSRWVTSEAARAAEFNKLTPALVSERVSIPIPFNTTNSLDLTGWNGDRTDPRYRILTALLHERAKQE